MNLDTPIAFDQCPVATIADKIQLELSRHQAGRKDVVGRTGTFELMVDTSMTNH